MPFTLVSLVATTLVASANAHVLMKSPVPFSVDKLDNSPITKSQYPCKSQNGFTISKMNAMAVGEKQTLQLSGSAVHGGGSCQLSVTLDTTPTANSVFKVIQSMEGGCPGTDGEAKAYDFTLPSSIPNGKATFAWTWNSKLSGQPELYMNCAPIEVTGGASDKTAFNALPDMLVANLDKSCETVANFALQYPNPGSVVQKGSTNDLKLPVGSSCGSTANAPADSSASVVQPSSIPTLPAASKPSTPAVQSSAAAIQSSASLKPSASTALGGVFAPGASSAAAPLPSTLTTLVIVTASPSPIASALPTGTAPTVSLSSGTGVPSTQPSGQPATGGTTCSTNGAIVCNGTSQFGLCNNGKVVWQNVAAGTTCEGGVISKRGYRGRVARPRLVLV